jgi:hypothetical protein
MKTSLLLFAFLFVAVSWSGCGQNTNVPNQGTPLPSTPTPRQIRSPSPSPSPPSDSGSNEDPHKPDHHEIGEIKETDTPGKTICRCTCEGELLWERELTEAECKSQCRDGEPCG